MRRGARTFVQKPWDNVALAQTIRREIVEGRASRQAGLRASRELEHARLIQQALLPESLPIVRACEMAVLWKPAGVFGGDCYDARCLDGSCVALSIADVAGKGLGEGTDPHALVTHVNRLLCANSSLGTFVTFCHAVVDCAARRLRYTNAGHNPPIVVRQDGSFVRLTEGGLVLGVRADAPYEQGEVSLAPGDRIVFFTDGLTEAERPDGADFGDARLVDAVVRRRRLSARALLEATFDEVRAFTGGAFQDDATLLVVGMSLKE
jgi:sigma-B regulation protein RsbU (phosphoserine phosphatase)